jgi:glycosyltransferase involved in cell wall biosynthesis
VRNLVTCVVPVRDGARFLGEALDSILAQTWRPFEVIVVDDGSTDETAVVAGRYGQRVRYFRQEPRGPAAARNRGVGAAMGSLIAFLDSDDLWAPDKLARQMSGMDTLDLNFTQYQNFWDSGLAEEEARYRDHPLSKPSTEQCISTLLVRSDMLKRLGGFDERRLHGENTPLFMKAARTGARVGMVPEVLAYRRFHANSYTRTDPKGVREALLLNLKEWKNAKRRDAPDPPV